MSNFDINVDRRTNGQTYGKADAYVAKSGGQGDVSCKVWWLFSLVVDQNTNFDINVERRHKCWQTDGRTENRTPISHPATSRCDKKQLKLRYMLSQTSICNISAPSDHGHLYCASRKTSLSFPQNVYICTVLRSIHAMKKCPGLPY